MYRVRLRFALVAAIVFLVSWTSVASAESVFIPVDFGAAYEPHQLNQLAVQSSVEDGRFGMLSMQDRDVRLEAHFPSLSLPEVSDFKIDLDEGNQAYFNGEYDKAAGLLSGAVEASTQHPISLTLRPAFADTVYQSGLYLVQIFYFVLEKPNEAEVVIERLARYFPTQVPSEEQFPPDLVDLYRKYLPGTATGKTLTLKVGPGCSARVNGMALPPGDATLVVLPGEYGLAEVCNEQTTRAWVVGVQRDTIVDFHGIFAQSYTYPLSLMLNGRQFQNDPTTLADLLATVGERVGVSHVVGGGLVPGEGGDGYRLLLVDVAQRIIVREFTLPPAEVATPSGMKDAMNSLWTGEEFKIVTLHTGGGGVSWTTLGLIGAGVGGGLVIGGSVFGVMAKNANDEFFTCNASAECRGSEQDKTHLEDRKTNSTIADALYISGGVVLLAGGIVIILDQAGVFSGESDTPADDSASAWNFSVSPTPGGGYVGFHLAW